MNEQSIVGIKTRFLKALVVLAAVALLCACSKNDVNNGGGTAAPAGSWDSMSWDQNSWS
jgi:uncharacterized lipoprotein YajG